MRKLVLALFISLLHCCPLFSFSQDSIPQRDTMMTTEAAAEDTDATPFNVVSTLGPVSARAVPQRRIDSMLKEDDFWYANTAPERAKKKAAETTQNEESPANHAWFRHLLWIVVLCSFIAIVLWYLYSSNILVFRRAAKKISDEEGEEEELTDDIFALNYEKEIAKAIDAKAFRQAVRLWYLRTLKELSDKSLIDYRYGRTNGDYASQLYKTIYYRDFFRLTRAFEYTWYGQFEPSAEAFNSMQTDFVNFKKALGR